MSKGKDVATAQISGNTKTGDLAELVEKVDTKDFKKKRDFFITLNYEQNEDKHEAQVMLITKYGRIKEYLLKLKYKYFISCMELNEKGFYHIHIFIQFDTPHKLCISKMEGANIQIRKGSVNQCINYIRKDNNILNEFGTPGYLHGNPSIKDISLSRFKDINEECDARYYRVYKEIKKDNQPTLNTKKNIFVARNKDDIKNNINKFKLNIYNYFEISEGKIKQFPHNMILKEKFVKKSNLDLLLNDFNEPIQFKYFPADIENIILITNEYNNILYSLRENYNDVINNIIYLYDTFELDENEI